MNSKKAIVSKSKRAATTAAPIQPKLQRRDPAVFDKELSAGNFRI